MKLKNFKKGDKVVMFDCMESHTPPENYGKVWECEDDSFQRKFKGATEQQPELVFLKGFSGSFWCKYLQLANIEDK